ncbi:MAG: hypothetical protein HY819_13865 [Acidobacteria bacterium]|nr:hypothetical protein [Acidobacteriota bacterium]
MRITDTSANKVADLQNNDQSLEQAKATSTRGANGAANLAQTPQNSPMQNTQMRRVPAGSEDLVAARNGMDIRSTGAFAKLATGTWRAAAPVALPDGQADKAYDGKFIGAGAKAYPTNTPLSDIPAVRPNNGTPSNGETIIYVNGINTEKSGQANSMQAIANRTGSNVVGIHNSTEGMLKDLAQSLGDKADLGNNPAVNSVANAVYNEIKAGRQVHLMGHSQGGLILSRALTDVKNRLMIEGGMSRSQAENTLKNVKVETFGAAAGSYPDGPKYIHYVNRADPVPVLFGLGAFKGLFNGDRSAGKDAKVVRFTQFSDVHDFNNTYLNRRQPF